MRLKIFVTTMIVATVVLWICRPIILGPIPHRPATKRAVLVYSERALGFVGLLIVTVTGAGVGSIVLVRRAKRDYQELAMANMQSLIEGAIEDHKKVAEKQTDA